MGSIGIWQLLVVLAIIILLFGTKKLRGIGGDLGGAVKGFKKAMSDDKSTDQTEQETTEQIQKSESAAPSEPVNTEKTKDNNRV